MLDSPGSQLRAVVVDDDVDVRLLIRRTLQLQGFVVFEAGSGAEALLKIQEHRPDLVTLDLDLPDLDGVEVCRRLRKFSDAYVVMITARADEIDELMGLEIGADDFIRKPFSPRLVQARVTSSDAAPPPNPSTPHAAAPRDGFHDGCFHAAHAAGSRRLRARRAWAARRFRNARRPPATGGRRRIRPPNLGFLAGQCRRASRVRPPVVRSHRSHRGRRPACTCQRRPPARSTGCRRRRPGGIPSWCRAGIDAHGIRSSGGSGRSAASSVDPESPFDAGVGQRMEQGGAPRGGARRQPAQEARRQRPRTAVHPHGTRRWLPDGAGGSGKRSCRHVQPPRSRRGLAPEFFRTNARSIVHSWLGERPGGGFPGLPPDRRQHDDHQQGRRAVEEH